MRLAVIFDLDGTLIDSVDDLTSAVNAYLAPLGYPATERAALMGRMGDGALQLLHRTIVEGGGEPPASGDMIAMAEAFSDFYDRFPHRRTRLFDGFPDVLDILREAGYVLGVCTNKRSDLSCSLLASLGILDRFDGVIGGDDPQRLKPHPAPLLDMLGKLDVAPCNAVMVGDSINDILVGRRVGARTVAARYGFPRRPDELVSADAFIDSPAELPSVMLKLGGGRESAST